MVAERARRFRASHRGGHSTVRTIGQHSFRLRAITCILHDSSGTFGSHRPALNTVRPAAAQLVRSAHRHAIGAVVCRARSRAGDVAAADIGADGRRRWANGDATIGRSHCAVDARIACIVRDACVDRIDERELGDVPAPGERDHAKVCHDPTNQKVPPRETPVGPAATCTEGSDTIQ